MKNVMSAKCGSASGGKKAVVIFFICNFIFLPQLALASVDQYGKLYDPEGTLRYVYLNDSPDYLSGYLAKPQSSMLFYWPQIDAAKIAPRTELVVFPMLSDNEENDTLICREASLFAKGKYTQENLIRIKPVCANLQENVIADIKINSQDYYKELPTISDQEITKVYHYEISKLKNVFTDRPEIAELYGKVVQGETDPAMYFIDKVNGEYMLRQIFDDKVKLRVGQDYKEKIVYFDDSIIYTYKIGQAIN
jgi:hypothetical protein